MILQFVLAQVGLIYVAVTLHLLYGAFHNANGGHLGELPYRVEIFIKVIFTVLFWPLLGLADILKGMGRTLAGRTR